MSYLTNLLRQSEPLDLHEVRDLRDWLTVLEADCVTFGETPEDDLRIAEIAARLEREQSRAPSPPSPGRAEK